jgi:hypothetical protein
MIIDKVLDSFLFIEDEKWYKHYKRGAVYAWEKGKEMIKRNKGKEVSDNFMEAIDIFFKEVMRDLSEAKQLLYKMKRVRTTENFVSRCMLDGRMSLDQIEKEISFIEEMEKSCKDEVEKITTGQFA